MTSKYTPGPWKAHKYPDVKSWTVAGEQSVASKIKTEDDARLIAASPRLLDELKKAVQRCPCSLKERLSGHLIDCWVPDALEVISEAEGG